MMGNETQQNCFLGMCPQVEKLKEAKAKYKEATGEDYASPAQEMPRSQPAAASTIRNASGLWQDLVRDLVNAHASAIVKGTCVTSRSGVPGACT